MHLRPGRLCSLSLRERVGVRGNCHCPLLLCSCSCSCSCSCRERASARLKALFQCPHAGRAGKGRSRAPFQPHAPRVVRPACGGVPCDARKIGGWRDGYIPVPLPNGGIHAATLRALSRFSCASRLTKRGPKKRALLAYHGRQLSADTFKSKAKQSKATQVSVQSRKAPTLINASEGFTGKITPAQEGRAVSAPLAGESCTQPRHPCR